jgi:hypothetical protein
MLNRVLLIGCLLAAAVLVQPVLAQSTLHKSTMPDGTVVYGDKPMPGAVKVESSKPDTSKQGILPPTAGEKATLQNLEVERRGREAAADKVRAAEKALAAAEAARTAGQEPREGERIGTATGASRLTDAYLQRQKNLEEAVARARRDLENAKAGK